MGIQLTDIVKGEEITLENLFDKAIAIDSFNWIHQFLSTIRQKDGEPLKDFKGNITSHLSGLFYRTIKIMEADVKPVYVFDGKPPEFKKQESERRRDIRAEAMREWKEALKREDYEAARKFAQRTSAIDENIINECKKLLSAMGVPAIQAPSEGEAMCSVMAGNNDVYAAATQDYDSLLFGCPKLVRNLSISGKKKRGDSYITVSPEIIMLENVIKALEITHEQLILIGILIGTDYNPGGVAGFGPKRALELVREKKTLDAVLKEVVWDFDVAPEDIHDFFLHPQAGSYEIKFTDLDEDKIKELLCDEHDFSEERIDNAIKRLIEKKKSEQKSLSRWF